MDKALVIPQNTWHQHIWVNFDICQVNASQGNEKTMSICLVDIYEVLGIATNFPNWLDSDSHGRNLIPQLLWCERFLEKTNSVKILKAGLIILWK